MGPLPQLREQSLRPTFGGRPRIRSEILPAGTMGRTSDPRGTRLPHRVGRRGDSRRGPARGERRGHPPIARRGDPRRRRGDFPVCAFPEKRRTRVRRGNTGRLAEARSVGRARSRGGRTPARPVPIDVPARFVGRVCPRASGWAEDLVFYRHPPPRA